MPHRGDPQGVEQRINPMAQEARSRDLPFPPTRYLRAEFKFPASDHPNGTCRHRCRDNQSPRDGLLRSIRFTKTFLAEMRSNRQEMASQSSSTFGDSLG